ncbi:hypothetical protein PMI29_00142 [Pseudomonas sp. GM49]|nr:hypothetical protein PMI29_00142 [Pseudomonas sp. GM49]
MLAKAVCQLTYLGLIHRFREQVRSHKSGGGIPNCDTVQNRIGLFLRPATERSPLCLPKRAILVGQSLPPAFHPAEANLSCTPICVTLSVH